MNRVARFEFALWAACMVFGATLMFAETRIAARRSAHDDATPFIANSYDSFAAEVSESGILSCRSSEERTTALPASARPINVSRDTALVAGLLVESVVQIESSGDPRQVGRHGERGLMQIKAGTWNDVTRHLYGSRISFDRAFEPKLNRQVGAAYLAELQRFLLDHKRFWRADERSLLLACYNAGPERVRQAGFDIRRLPALTRDYVARGSALHDAFLADHNLTMSQLRLALDGGVSRTAHGS